jgi:hypothetical protein
VFPSFPVVNSPTPVSPSHRFECLRDDAVSAWWALPKVLDRRDFIREIHDVYLPGRTGFLAKSTTLMMAWGCWMLPTENAFHPIHVDPC